MEFANRLKRLRKELKLTQEQLSHELNIARSTISGYETERKEPDYDTLIYIANYFDVSIDYILGRTNVRKYPVEIVKDEAIDDIDNLSPESKEDLKRYLELLKIKDMQERNSDCGEIKRSE